MSVRFTPRKGKNGELYGALLSVRPAIARHVPEDARFEAELTEDGILFRFVGIDPRGRPAPDPDGIPTWANAES